MDNIQTSEDINARMLAAVMFVLPLHILSS